MPEESPDPKLDEYLSAAHRGVGQPTKDNGYEFGSTVSHNQGTTTPKGGTGADADLVASELNTIDLRPLQVRKKDIDRIHMDG